MAQNSNKVLKIWTILMKLGSLCGCHQLYDRSFKYKTYQFPLCARCTGILIGEITSIFLFISGIRFSLMFSTIFIIPMAFDGVIQLLEIKESNNVKRIITGFFAGIGYINILFIALINIKRFIY